jgi:hypothetical protein
LVFSIAFWIIGRYGIKKITVKVGKDRKEFVDSRRFLIIISAY